jgi:outer membrane protein
MKLKSLILFILFLSSPTWAALSLKTAFQSARLHMETLKRSEALVNQSEELKIQARAAALPTISGVGTYTRIDPPKTSGNSPSPFLLTRQYTAGLRLVQPLIRGGLISGYQLAKENVLLAKFQKDASELSLYQLVISAYFNLNIAQVDRRNVEELLKYSRERVEEIRERTKIGKSRKGELVEAEAQLLSAESQYQQTLITLQQAERNFEFFTGTKAEEIGGLGEVSKLNTPMTEYLQKVRARPDILAADQQARLAERQISIAKGSHYPSVDLVGNYYFDRTGVLATSEWDVGFTVNFPLFQGGAVQSNVREAVEGKRIAELTSSETRRAAERDLMINYQNLVQLQLQLKAQKAALEKAEAAYRLNKKDYGFGLVTNLDVLQSLNLFIETKRAYNTLVALTHLNYRSLEAATGVLP